MPSDEVWLFVIMKTCGYFILNLLAIVNSSNISITTKQDPFPVCPASHNRSKREYTRWRGNLKTTSEFILKVEEDLTTKKVLGVNVQQPTWDDEKIIIGGAIVPPHVPTITTLETPITYTRFVPPTTIPVAKVDNDLFLAPAPKPIPTVLPSSILRPDMPRVHGYPYIAQKHALRDESPPASPQFLPRSLAEAQQFVPVAPVAFTKRATETPPVINTHRSNIVTRTDLPYSYMTRTKSDSEEFEKFVQDLDGQFDETIITRTTPAIEALRYGHRNSVNTDDFFIDNNLLEPEISTRRHLIQDNDEDVGLDMRQYDEKNTDVKNEYQKIPDDSPNDKNAALSEDYSENAVTMKVSLTAGEYYNIDHKMTAKPAGKLETDLVTNITRTRSGNPRYFCSLVKYRQLNFKFPRTLPEIMMQLKKWAEQSPITKIVDITMGNLTNMENPIYMIIIDDPSTGQIESAKKTVMIVAGMQGRDHHAVTAAMYVLFQLIERSENQADLLGRFRFWIIPVFNPDGYDYSMTFPHRREWIKNLRQTWDKCKGRKNCNDMCEKSGLRCAIQSCYGVHLDRNFEYQWIPPEELKSEHPCGDLYAGPRQLSEPETRAFTHFLHSQRTSVYIFIAFKEGDILGVMYPYSHTKKRRAFDDTYRQRAARAASAAYSIGGRPYVAGQTSEFLPLHAGGIEDWVDGHLGIDNSYSVMMFRPSDSYNTKLITERVVHEAYAAMDTLLLQSSEGLMGHQKMLVSHTNTANKIRWSIALFFVPLATRLVRS